MTFQRNILINPTPFFSFVINGNECKELDVRVIKGSKIPAERYPGTQTRQGNQTHAQQRTYNDQNDTKVNEQLGLN